MIATPSTSIDEEYPAYLAVRDKYSMSITSLDVCDVHYMTFTGDALSVSFIVEKSNFLSPESVEWIHWFVLFQTSTFVARSQDGLQLECKSCKSIPL